MLFLLSLLLAATTPPVLDPGVDWHWTPPAEKVDVPLALLAKVLPAIGITLGEQSELFVLDTGAYRTLFDMALARRLGLDVFGQGNWSAGALPGFRYVRAPAIVIGPAMLEAHVVTVADWHASDFGEGMPWTAGFLGSDFLSRVVTTIDYPASRVTLTAQGKFAPDKNDVAIPCARRGDALYVEARVSGRDAHLLVDTGHTEALVITHLPNQRGLVTKAEEGFYNPAGDYGIGQSAATWPAWGDLTVGPFRWRRVLMDVYDPNTRKGYADQVDGLLGSRFWKHFVLTYDLAGSRIWLRQAVPFGDHEDDCMFGLGLVRVAGTVKVRSVLVKGPAAAAGLRQGDEVASINGLPSASLTGLFNASGSCAVGDVLTLETVRDGKPRTIKITATRIP